MTTAIAHRQSTEVTRGVDVLEGVSFTDLIAFGDQLTKTGFLPDHIRTGPQFAAIVMTGRELGMTPMRAVRSLHMVKGKVLEAADSQLARFKASGGRAVFDVLDETKAVLTLTHPNGDKHTETWTVDDSKRAGLTGGNHDKFRKAMLRSRCITAGLKSLGWDGAVGTYDPDEMRVDEPVIEKPVESSPDDVARAKAARAEELARTTANAIAHAELMLDEAVDAERLAELHDKIGDVAGNSAKLKAALVALSDQVSCRISDVAWIPADADVQKAVVWLRGEVGKVQAARTTTTTTTTEAA